MKLISMIVFYSEKPEEEILQEDRLPNLFSAKKETKLSSRILQAKYDLLNFPFGREQASKSKSKAAVPVKEYELELEPQATGAEPALELTPLELDPVLVPPPIKLKTECCEKYLKGKRCGRCPCFDLPYGPASLSN